MWPFPGAAGFYTHPPPPDNIFLAPQAPPARRPRRAVTLRVDAATLCVDAATLCINAATLCVNAVPLVVSAEVLVVNAPVSA